jgi:YaiO family outer membrane protein
MRIVAFVLFSLLICQLSFGQEDIDAGFKQVRTMSEKKDYNGALKVLTALEKKYPNNEDILVYEGRVYSWRRDFSKAKKILRPLVDDKDKPNSEALEALINAYYWSYDFEGCITYCDKYLDLYTDSPEILTIKATCLEKSGRDAEALAILNQLPAPYNTNEKTTALKTAITRKKKNAIAASYLNVSTADPGESPAHYAYVEYLRKFTKSTLIGRVNYGDRYGGQEVQFEADYYHTFRKGYLYTNAGFSSRAEIFPNYKVGTEYYFAPLKQFDFSFGARYMNFVEDDVVLLTGQAAYRFKDYTLAYRPFYDANNTLFSHVLSIQKYNESKENLIRFELQSGNVPYLYIYSNFTEPLTAYRAGIQYQHRFGDSFFVRPVFLYEYEEYVPDSYRHKFNCQVIFTKQF